MFQILVVEDDHQIRALIKRFLEKNGYAVKEATNGLDALDLFTHQPFDLVITDVMMPSLDGYQLTKQIRRMNQDIPILILSALDQYHNKEKGFMSGSDDYMVKPVDVQEMLLRIRALLKRYNIMRAKKIELPHLSLDYNNLTCVVNQETVELTKKEFLLLFTLLSSANQIFTREQLMNEIWGYNSESYNRTIDTHIKRIRERVISEDFDIITVRGLGYKAVIKHA